MTDIDPSAMTFVRQKFPDSDRFFASARDRMRVQSTSASPAQGAQAFWRLRLSIPARLEVVSATLEARTEEAAVGDIVARSVDPATGAYRALTWNTRPAVVAGLADRSATISGSRSRQLTWTVTADVNDALAADRGRIAFRISSTSTAAQWIDASSVSLVVVTRPRSSDPTDLAPAGLVGTIKPVFSWTAPAGVTKVQLQVDDATDFATPVYDSGELNSTTPRVDSATGPVWAGLSGTMYARARHFTAAGWSAWTQVTVSFNAPTVFAVSNPGASSADASPPSVWTPAAQAFEIVTFLDGVRQGSTGLVPGPVSSWTPKHTAKKAGQVLKRVHRFYDGVARVQPPYSEVVTSTTFSPTATVAGLGTFTAAQIEGLPAAQVGWTRTEVPDEVGIWRDDTLVAQPNGPDGSWVDWLIPPNTDITYQGTAVVNGEHSNARKTVNLRTAVTGVWLVDAYSGPGFEGGDLADVRGCVLSGLGIEIGYGDVTVVHTPIDGAVLLRRTLVLRGPEGSMDGWLGDWPGRTREQQLDDIEWLRDRPERTLRLICGDLNLPVSVSSLQAIFDAERTFTNRVEHRVSFTFSHAGGV